jgi:phosphoribosylformylglycinamidine cyclo-ligase
MLKHFLLSRFYDDIDYIIFLRRKTAAAKKRRRQSARQSGTPKGKHKYCLPPAYFPDTIRINKCIDGDECMRDEPLSYRAAGIDIGRTDQMKREMTDLLNVADPRVLNRLGAFASLYDLGNFQGIDEPVLVLKAEEPGSKQKLAFDFGYEASICHDMINHLVNDAIVMGARPLAVLDVIIAGSINEAVIKTLVREMALACRNNGCSLVGGETSIQPGIVSENLCILSSSVAGIVDKKRIIDGGEIRAGDRVLAVASNGLHTNGYTLVRKMMTMDTGLIQRKIVGDKTFLQCVMEPHTAYYPIMKAALRPEVWHEVIHGMAHITGGGIQGNLCRIIPQGLRANIDLAKLRPLPIFRFIRDFGNIGDEEMLATFNCGVGLILVVPPEHKDEIERAVAASLPCYEIGSIEEAPGQDNISFQNALNWR